MVYVKRIFIRSKGGILIDINKNMPRKFLRAACGSVIAVAGFFAVATSAYAATPSVVSVKLTGSNIVTVIYSEPVITNSWNYTNFSGNLSGYGVTYISGSGSSVVTLTLSGSPTISNGSSGYLSIGTGVTSVSTGSAFPGGTYNVTNAQAPILSSVSVTVQNIGTTFSTTGSQIMLTFSTNESVVNPTVTLLGHTIGVSGTGVGPFTVNYTLLSSDAQGTIPATILFTDMNGNTGTATVTVLSNGGSTGSASGYVTSNATLSGVLYAGNTIIFTLVPSTAEPNVKSVTGSYNGVPLSWYTTNSGATYTAIYTVAAGQSNTTYPLQISGVSLIDQYGNTLGPFSGSDVEKTITATAVTGAVTIYQATAVTTPTTSVTPSYGFVSTVAGTIHYGGDCSSQTTYAVAGLNTVTFNTLTNGTHSNCTISVTDAAGNVSNQLVVSPFTVNTAGSTIATTTSNSAADQIASLESQLAALQGQTSGGTTVASSSYQFTSFLTIGSQGAEVTALQQRLIKDGFLSGSATGYFGTLTEAAVKKYQAAFGITQAGYVGPSTRVLLNAGK
jgi:hypothetical protein